MILGPIALLVALGAVIALLWMNNRKKSQALREIKSLMDDNTGSCKARYYKVATALDRAGYRLESDPPSCACAKCSSA